MLSYILDSDDVFFVVFVEMIMPNKNVKGASSRGPLMVVGTP